MSLFLAAGAGAGTVKPEPVALDQILESLGLEARAHQFTFDRPVYCTLTFELGSPDESNPVSKSISTTVPEKTLHVSYCITRPHAVAGALGLTVNGRPNTSYSLEVNELGFKGGFSDPFEVPDTFHGHELPPGNVNLNTDIIIDGMAGPMPDHSPYPATEADFLKHKRYLVIKVRFSEEKPK